MPAPRALVSPVVLRGLLVAAAALAPALLWSERAGWLAVVASPALLALAFARGDG